MKEVIRIDNCDIFVVGHTDVNLKNNGGWTALMFAARNGQKEALKMLLAHG